MVVSRSVVTAVCFPFCHSSTCLWRVCPLSFCFLIFLMLILKSSLCLNVILPLFIFTSQLVYGPLANFLSKSLIWISLFKRFKRFFFPIECAHNLICLFFTLQCVADLVCDATRMGSLARFINHCCEPNCLTKVPLFLFIYSWTKFSSPFHLIWRSSRRERVAATVEVVVAAALFYTPRETFTPEMSSPTITRCFKHSLVLIFWHFF